jgi:hypothetical protein
VSDCINVSRGISAIQIRNLGIDLIWMDSSELPGLPALTGFFTLDSTASSFVAHVAHRRIWNGECRNGAGGGSAIVAFDRGKKFI